jgi:hypothetical protein
MESQPQIVKKKETRGRKPKPKEEKKEEAVKAKKAQQPSVDDKYTQWKSLVPVLYDWLANHNLVWPSLSCRYPPAHKQYLSLSLRVISRVLSLSSSFQGFACVFCLLLRA